MRVLISGGAGFIGSSLTRALVRKGWHVTVLDCLAKQVHGEHAEGSYLYNLVKDCSTFVRGSVTDLAIWERLIPHSDIVVHFAAETGTGQSMYRVAEYMETNVTGTAQLLHVLTNTKHSVRKVLVASSRAVYGEGKYLCAQCGHVYPGSRQGKEMQSRDFNVKCPKCSANVEPLPTDEESALHPTSLYGLTKKFQEEMVMTMCPALGIQPFALRYQNVYGPGQSLSNPYTGILAVFSTILRNSGTIEIFEDGEESRDFVYIDDAIEATILALESDGPQGGPLNVGSGEQVTVLEIARKLAVAMGVPAKMRVTGRYRVGDIRSNVADLATVRKVLGYKRKTSIEEGLSRFVEWVLAQPIPEDRSQKSRSELKRAGMFK